VVGTKLIKFIFVEFLKVCVYDFESLSV